MPSMRDIKRRIKSVKSTQQITKAMKMVAAAKLRKAQEKVLAARPYSRRLKEVLGRLAGASADVSHPLLEVRETKRVGYVVVTADRGLCGGFNANILRMSNIEMNNQKQEVSMIAVGRKSRDFFRRLGRKIDSEFVALGDDLKYFQAKEIAQDVVKAYTEGVYDEVYLVYTEFVSAMTQRPTMIKLLPLETPEEDANDSQALYIYEPSAEAVLYDLLPKYLETTIYRALLESKASEMGARMTAMSSATDAAADMIGKLTLSFNRARQAAITREISEIVGGAAALE